MDPSKRGCLYPNEKTLQVFPKYSQENCGLECAWQYALEKCDCVPWYLAKLFPQARFCEMFDIECFSEVVDDRYSIKELSCLEECLPNCEETEYSAPTLTATKQRMEGKELEFCKKDTLFSQTKASRGLTNGQRLLCNFTQNAACLSPMKFKGETINTTW